MQNIRLAPSIVRTTSLCLSHDDNISVMHTGLNLNLAPFFSNLFLQQSIAKAFPFSGQFEQKIGLAEGETTPYPQGVALC